MNAPQDRTATRLQYRLRTLLLVVAVAAVLCWMGTKLGSQSGCAAFAFVATFLVVGVVGWFTQGTSAESQNLALATTGSILAGLAMLPWLIGLCPITFWTELSILLTVGLLPILGGVGIFFGMSWLSLKVWDNLAGSETSGVRDMCFAIVIALASLPLAVGLFKVHTARFGNYYDGPHRPFYFAIYLTMLLASLGVSCFLFWRATRVTELAPHWSKVIVFGYWCLYAVQFHLALFPTPYE